MAILVRVGNRIYSISSECSLSYANIHLSFKTVNLHKIMCEDFSLVFVRKWRIYWGFGAFKIHRAIKKIHQVFVSKTCKI